MSCVAGCATADWSETTAPGYRHPTHRPEINPYGWDDSNCAYILPDGHCAHPTAVNPADPTPPQPFNTWNSSNCAHIMADGQCAHPM